MEGAMSNLASLDVRRASPPSEAVAAKAKEAARVLAPLLDKLKKAKAKEVTIHPEAGNGKTAPISVTVPVEAFQLFFQILSMTASGNAVTLVPIHAELTTQEAAAILNVSRPYLIKLLKEEKLAYRTVGTHRRIRFEHLLKYMREEEARRKKAVDQLAAESQKLGFDY
jgi:excisionase family DNA binding protein